MLMQLIFIKCLYAGERGQHKGLLRTLHLPALSAMTF